MPGHVDPRKPGVTAPMCAMGRRIAPSVFGTARVTIHFKFNGQPASKPFGWLINEGTDVSLYPKDPDFDVSLFIITHLTTMMPIWVGGLRSAAAMVATALDISAGRKARRTFQSWLLPTA